MTSGKRVMRLAVSAAVLSAGAVVAGPATSTAAPAEQQRLSSESLSASSVQKAAAPAKRAKFKCSLALGFKPRVGKGNSRIKAIARTKCNRKMPKIWTSVQLKQTKAKNKYRKTSQNGSRRNKTIINSFCPRQFRKYTVVGKTTVLLPKSAKRKFIKIRKVGRQSGTCR